MDYNKIQKNIEDLNNELINDYEKNPSFDCLAVLRKSMASSHKANKADEGFRNLLTQLYPYNAHYIYELLQNAQDANKDNKLPATVSFTLTDTQLEFKHNGKKLFDIKDIDSITGLTVSTKIDDKTNIGKFGVGFKSVFAITNTPEIISGKYHFIIEKMFIPKLISDLSGNESPFSHFIFQFNNPNKPPEKAYNEIKNELLKLGSETLLFLKNINRLEYKINNNDTVNYIERKDMENNIIKIKVKKYNEDIKEYYWLRYDDNVPIIDEKGISINCPISIAFKLQKEENNDVKNNWEIKKAEPGKHYTIKISKKENKEIKNNYKIIKTEQGKVFIFFPAEKEDSKLFFYIHAPFASTVARDSIRECDENNQLRDKINNLLSIKLFDIKERGLLTIDFLGVLPNSQDNLLAFYKPIYNRIINTFQNSPILPTKSGDYARASMLYKGPVSISEIINDDDLSFLTKQNIPLWVKNAPPQHPREDHFIEDLKIKLWGDDELNIFFNPKTKENKERIENWIASKTDDNWLLKLFALFEERGINISNELRIVRTMKNQHTIASDIYFPPNDEDIPDTINFVKPEVFCKNDTEKRLKNAKYFLTRLGVKEYNFNEKIKLNIKALADKYTDKNTIISETHKHLEDIKQLVKYFERNEEDCRELFKEKHFILDINNNYCAVDSICSIEIGELIKCANLASKYRKNVINGIYNELEENVRRKFYSFLESLGVMNKLKVVAEEQIYNPRITDFIIIGLEDILPLINEDDYKYRFSLFIWKAICECDFNGMEGHKLEKKIDGRHKDNYYYSFNGQSTIIEILSSNPWLPDKNGNLYNPKDISLDMLPESFKNNYNQKSHLLIALKFGENILQQREKENQEIQKRYEAASTLGITLTQVEIIKKAEKNGINIEKILNDYENINEKNETDKPKEEVFDPTIEEFPEEPFKNIDNLKNTIKQVYLDALEVIREPVLKIIRTSYNRDIVRGTIRRKYNGFCQCCEKKYQSWEVTELFREPNKELEQMNLSLCPNCAWEYRKIRDNFNYKDKLDSFIKEILKTDPMGNGKVSLDGKTIRFTQTHLAEIQEILKIESEAKTLNFP